MRKNKILKAVVYLLLILTSVAVIITFDARNENNILVLGDLTAPSKFKSLDKSPVLVLLTFITFISILIYKIKIKFDEHKKNQI